MISKNFNNIAILKIKNADYHYIINTISKSEAINLMQNTNLTEKVEHYRKHKNLLKLSIRNNCKYENLQAINLLQILI